VAQDDALLRVRHLAIFPTVFQVVGINICISQAARRRKMGEKPEVLLRLAPSKKKNERNLSGKRGKIWKNYHSLRWHLAPSDKQPMFAMFEMLRCICICCATLSLLIIKIFHFPSF